MSTLNLDDLTLVEQAILRHAVEDHGPGIYANPLIGGSHQAVGRYLTEGGKLLPAHDWRDVWGCVTQLLEREPQVVTGPVPTQAELAERRDGRNRVADALLAAALEAFQQGRWSAAIELVDRAELVAPEYHPSGRSYEELRGFVRQRQTASTAELRG